MTIIKKGIEIELPNGENVILTKVTSSPNKIGFMDMNKKVGDKTAIKSIYILHYIREDGVPDKIETTIPSNQVELG